MTRAMTKDEAAKAWKEFPYRGDGDEWAEPVAAEFWRLRAAEDELRAAIAKAEQERDAAVQRLDEAAEKEAHAHKARQEAVADNAALLAMLRRLCEAIGEEPGDDMTREQMRTFGIYMEAVELVAKPHPSAAMKEPEGCVDASCATCRAGEPCR